MIIMMRTTLNLPDDISEVVRSVAAAKGISLGDAVSDLIRRGLNADREHQKDGLPCFAVAADAPPITLEHTLAIEDDL
jgi:hypothetical protein